MDTILNLILLVNGAFLAASVFFNSKETSCDVSLKNRTYKYTLAIIGWAFMMFALMRFYKIVPFNTLWSGFIALILALSTFVISLMNINCFQTMVVAETGITFGLLVLFSAYVYYTSRDKELRRRQSL
jgi:uncharacterized membrane protein YidH (DUF202 family)